MAVREDKKQGNTNSDSKAFRIIDSEGRAVKFGSLNDEQKQLFHTGAGHQVTIDNLLKKINKIDKKASEDSEGNIQDYAKQSKMLHEFVKEIKEKQLAVEVELLESLENNKVNQQDQIQEQQLVAAKILMMKEEEKKYEELLQDKLRPVLDEEKLGNVKFSDMFAKVPNSFVQMIKDRQERQPSQSLERQ